MSEQVSRLAVQQLRNVMFPTLPDFIKEKFPTTTDPLVAADAAVPNIFVGDITEGGANSGTPAITVNCEGSAEGSVKVYRHLLLHIDIWVGGNVAASGAGRRFVSILYQHIFDSLQNVNWSGRGGAQGSDYVQIKRCFESLRSSIMFEPTTKIYHLSNTYQVEALCKTWY